MLADFVVRLATGMVVALLLLSPVRSARPTPQTPPLANANFFRTQLLVILGLVVGALLWLRQEASWPLLVCLLVAAVSALLGSVSWSVERSPGAVMLIVATGLALGVALTMREGIGSKLAGGISSALLLGSATSAMLMGHNFLVAPNMTMTPLYRLLGALATALGLRLLIDGVALAWWTSEHDLANLTADALLWLPVRWLVGLLAPAVLCVMAWQTARIRSTQSATGILYVVVLFCFLGELTGQLLRPFGLTL
jgi:hypothetical protein